MDAVLHQHFRKNPDSIDRGDSDPKVVVLPQGSRLVVPSGPIQDLPADNDRRLTERVLEKERPFQAVRGHDRVDMPDEGSRPVDVLDPGSQESDLGVVFEESNLALEALGVADVIRVHGVDVRPACEPNPHVAGGDEADTRGVEPDNNPFVLGFQSFEFSSSFIRRLVADDDQLQGRAGLGQYARDRLSVKRVLPVEGHDNADQGSLRSADSVLSLCCLRGPGTVDHCRLL